ncbi:MAG: acetolactate decarboxylase [Bacteroidota bacterium]
MRSLVIYIGLAMGCLGFAFPGNDFEVKHLGALRNMMHKGDISAKGALRDFENQPHLFGLGAVEDLKGEILILDGKPYITSVVEGEIETDQSFEKNATLFVYAQVEAWTEIKIPRKIKSYAQLESFVEQAAQKQGIDTELAFPFLVEGQLGAGDWHVIDWPEGDTEHTHEKHIQSGLNGTISNEKVKILGFWSNKHHAIFTHHTTNMHLHFRTEDGRLAGHLDDLKLGRKMKLMLPK